MLNVPDVVIFLWLLKCRLIGSCTVPFDLTIIFHEQNIIKSSTSTTGELLQFVLTPFAPSLSSLRVRFLIFREVKLVPVFVGFGIVLSIQFFW